MPFMLWELILVYILSARTLIPPTRLNAIQPSFRHRNGALFDRFRITPGIILCIVTSAGT
jgi:hypothetical protein